MNDETSSRTEATEPRTEARWESWARILAPLIHDGLIDTPQERQIPDKAFYLARLLDEHLPAEAAQGAAPRMEWPKFEPGEACPDCKAVMHGTPCVHHEDWCPVIVEGISRAEGTVCAACGQTPRPSLVTVENALDEAWLGSHDARSIARPPDLAEHLHEALLDYSAIEASEGAAPRAEGQRVGINGRHIHAAGITDMVRCEECRRAAPRGETRAEGLDVPPSNLLAEAIHSTRLPGHDSHAIEECIDPTYSLTAWAERVHDWLARLSRPSDEEEPQRVQES